MQKMTMMLMMVLLAVCTVWTTSAWTLPASARRILSRASHVSTTSLSAAYEECIPGKFDDIVTKAQGPVLVDFYANWCGPCKIMTPIFSQLSDELAGKVKFVKVDSDEHGEEVERFNIPGLPFFAIFHNGKMIASQAGAMRKEALQDFINRSLQAKGITI